jgi:hypothetical protein
MESCQSASQETLLQQPGMKPTTLAQGGPNRICQTENEVNQQRFYQMESAKWKMNGISRSCTKWNQLNGK